jgi:hypothetical protein
MIPNPDQVGSLAIGESVIPTFFGACYDRPEVSEGSLEVSHDPRQVVEC